MAIYLRNNVVSMVRASKCPYWKIYENDQKKTAGNFVASADFEVADLGINAATDDLQIKLGHLSQGRYILTSYEKNDGKRKGLDSWIELEALAGANQPSAISGVNTPAEFFMEGIGKVNAENFEDAIEKKMAGMLEKQRKIDEEIALRAEVALLRREARENESGFNKGLMSIGAVLYPHVSKTPGFKDLVAVVGTAVAQSNTANINGTAAPAAAEPGAEELPANHVEGDLCEIGGVHVEQARLFGALDKLGANNPEVLKHLELLANLKENDQSMYDMAVSFAETKI